MTPMWNSMLLRLPLRAAAVAASSSTSSSSSARFLPTRAPTDDPAHLRVAVLTGWLGAGKTTTLRRWLEAAAAEREEAGGDEGGQGRRAPPRVRLIVNDVGAASVDAAVLSKNSETVVPPASLVALTTGCVCCSLQAELVDAVAAAAADARDFAAEALSSSSSSPPSLALLPDSWLFIECTGLALPSPVANAVAEGTRRAAAKGNGGEDAEDFEEEEDEESLEAVVAVVDASTFAAGLAGAFDVDDDDDEEDFVEEEEDAADDDEGPTRSFSPRDFAADEGPFDELAGVASPEGSVADLLASQVEAADVVLLNKADAVSLESLEEARALVEALNPGAKVVEAVRGDVPPAALLGEAAAAAALASSDDGGRSRRRRRGVAGWAAALAAAAAARRGDGGKEKGEEGAHSSHSHSHSHHEEGDGDHDGHHHDHDHEHHHHHHHGEDKNLHPSAHGISSFVFHSPRPFHPQRLLRALEDDGGGGASGGGGPWKGVVRSKGFFWLATRPRVAGLWQAAGGSWAGDPSHLWERAGDGDEEDEASPSSSPSSSSSSSPQQELVFIGNRLMSERRVREALESALLTDEEMRGGEESWSRFEDELPPWELLEG